MAAVAREAYADKIASSAKSRFSALRPLEEVEGRAAVCEQIKITFSIRSTIFALPD
jgi:hypothetical protein